MADSPDFSSARARGQLATLAARGVFLGTSSWKYPGWLGTLYTADRYTYRGRLSEKRFEALCLEEYAQVLPTVGVDATYYRFPDERLLAGLAGQAPPGFQFSFKVTNEITLRRFTRLPRFAERAGTVNAHFLDADLFVTRFLEPCQPFRDRIGVLMFEFSRFYPADFARGREFVSALDAFFGRLPKGWRYAVELRNRSFLQPEYLEMLATHGAGHVFNSWETMLPLDEQLDLAAKSPPAPFAAARLLLRPGRKYEEAVKRFSPYNEVRDPYPEGRAAAVRLIREVLLRRGPDQAFIYVNNRFEGNALATIAAILDAASTD